MTKAIIIPARYESTRFPGKPLALISGKSMIERVIATAQKSKLADRVIVATDDIRIVNFLKEKPDIEVCLTSSKHKCGTDRVSEIVKNNTDINFIVNLQGDEPLMPTEYIDKVLETLLKGEHDMASLITPIRTKEELDDKSIVKVVMDKNNFALYFSRSCIPFNRKFSNPDEKGHIKDGVYYRHIGIYGYTRKAILEFNLLPVSELEELEQLEQLRALENGFKIKLSVVQKSYPAVDKPEDIKEVEKILSGLSV